MIGLVSCASSVTRGSFEAGNWEVRGVEREDWTGREEVDGWEEVAEEVEGWVEVVDEEEAKGEDVVSARCFFLACGCCEEESSSELEP